MTDFNKLADALENIAHMEYPSGHHDGNNLREAARILRAAGAADVAKLMMLHDVAAETRRVLISGGNVPQNEADRSRQTRAALESALRVALAPKANDWIEIEQGSLPPLGEQVLVWCKYGLHWGPMVDCWDEQHEAPLSFSSATIPIGPGWDSGSDFYDVTHWMRIGSPPAAQPGAQEPAK